MNRSLVCLVLLALNSLCGGHSVSSHTAGAIFGHSAAHGELLPGQYTCRQGHPVGLQRAARPSATRGHVCCNDSRERALAACQYCSQ